jgi:polyphosphate kinase
MNETNGSASGNGMNDGGTRSGEMLSDVETSNNNENTQLDDEGSETRTDNEPGRGGSHSADAPKVRFKRIIIDDEGIRIAPAFFDNQLTADEARHTLTSIPWSSLSISKIFKAIIALLQNSQAYIQWAERGEDAVHLTPDEIDGILKSDYGVDVGIKLITSTIQQYDRLVKTINAEPVRLNFDKDKLGAKINDRIIVNKEDIRIAPMLFNKPNIPVKHAMSVLRTAQTLPIGIPQQFDAIITILQDNEEHTFRSQAEYEAGPIYKTPVEIQRDLKSICNISMELHDIKEIILRMTQILDPTPPAHFGRFKLESTPTVAEKIQKKLKNVHGIERSLADIEAMILDFQHPDLMANTDDIINKVNGGTTMTTGINTAEMPYIDRELSWISFNNRVLSLADKDTTPLLERVKFLSIANSNLDEFFAVRVASRLKDDEELDDEEEDEVEDRQVVNNIISECKSMVERMDSTYRHLIDKLAESDIHILTDFERNKVKKYFNYTIKPALAPLALDVTRPIPHLKPLSIYIALFVETADGTERMGLIEIPTHLDRIVKIGKHGWYFIEDIILANITDLYPGSTCSDITIFRVIRDGDTVVVDEDKGYVETMVMNVQSRMLYNDPVRLDILAGANKKIKSALQSSLDIPSRYVFHVQERIKMSDVIQLYKASDDPALKYPHFKPRPLYEEHNKKTMLARIAKRDVLVHHPYESFTDSVVRFIRDACEDPHVISIKQTLYRSGNDSKIIRHLIKAAEAGKNVTVVMELKARYDEGTNIEWADKLQRAGATVVYGYEHIKTHAKMTHVFRLKGKTGEQFCHIGTGNYSEKNSKVYTDYSYFTSDKKVCSDINSIFNMLTGGFISEDSQLNNIKIAPIAIRSTLYTLIDQQIALGSDGRIIIKVNNLSDPGMAEKLYQASNAGVNIDIICRSACSLIAGIPGYSENIKVKSIVGRFLEHSRVFQFGDDVFLSSSDLMTRNLDRRLELMFMVSDPNLKLRVQGNLQVLLDDTENSFISYAVGYVPYRELNLVRGEDGAAPDAPSSLDAHKYFIR